MICGDWRHRAGCVSENPELFFPIGTTGPAVRQLAQTQPVCARCPVSPEVIALVRISAGQE